MPDIHAILSTISSAVSLASRLKSVSEYVKEVEFQKLLADLQFELSGLKAQAAGLLDENTDLKRRIRELEAGPLPDRCPRCQETKWAPQWSLGGMRFYQCSSCGFSENRPV